MRPGGRHELRLQNPWGLSNPLVFYVGELPEIVKQEPAEVDVPLPPKLRKPNAPPPVAPAPPVVDVTLPLVVNGQILPGQVDRYRFQARKGEHLVAAVRARELMPYLADAVPGWFQGGCHAPR